MLPARPGLAPRPTTEFFPEKKAVYGRPSLKGYTLARRQSFKKNKFLDIWRSFKYSLFKFPEPAKSNAIEGVIAHASLFPQNCTEARAGGHE
jgi:hypothetical protein